MARGAIGDLGFAQWVDRERQARPWTAFVEKTRFTLAETGARAAGETQCEAGEAKGDRSSEPHGSQSTTGLDRGQRVVWRTPFRNAKDSQPLPDPWKYVAIEGVIGVGKTTLARLLSERVGGRLVLEEFEENPFLPEFYRDPYRNALSTQLFFLLSRFRQQEQLLQPELFEPRVITDYLFEKDQLFARLTLDGDEQSIYDQLFRVLRPQVPIPDLVIYLRADTPVILDRIRARGRPFEADIDPGYIAALGEAYSRFFATYTEAPLVVVDTGDDDLGFGSNAFEALAAGLRSGQLPDRLYGLESRSRDPLLPGF